MDRDHVTAWVDRYERLWRTAGTSGLAELFTDDASYSMEPYGEPFRGLDAIGAMWEAERDGPAEVFTMSSQIVAVDGETGVVRVEVHYGDPAREYRDLWILRFADDGRCRQFEEWPFAPHRADGGRADHV